MTHGDTLRSLCGTRGRRDRNNDASQVNKSVLKIESFLLFHTIDFMKIYMYKVWYLYDTDNFIYDNNQYSFLPKKDITYILILTRYILWKHIQIEGNSILFSINHIVCTGTISFFIFYRMILILKRFTKPIYHNRTNYM